MNYKSISIRSSLQKLNTAVCLSAILFCSLLVVYNLYDNMLNKTGFYRATISLLMFSLCFFLTVVNKKAGIMVSLFALPLLPNITMQFQAFTGYGRIMHQHSPGLDLIAGLILGSIVNDLILTFKNRFNQTREFIFFELPWQASLVFWFVSFSAILAVFRNLHQSQSAVILNTVIYQLTHFRTIAWHNDYRPIFDFVSYGLAFGFIGILIPVIHSSSDKNSIVFKPLFGGIIIASIVAIIQSQTGRGLHPWQSFFRNDHLGFIATGFQPDIHSFAGHMMLGAVGFFGYLYYTKEISIKLFGWILVIPLAWIGLVLSKSKSNIALAFFFLSSSILILIFRKMGFSKKTIFIITTVCFLFALLLTLLFPIWSPIFSSLPIQFKYDDFNAFNLFMSYRPEIYAAAIRMFWSFPLLGLGQGNFYRLSSNPEFSLSSFLSIDQNGENAHNYFLQILAENGLIGLFLFGLLIINPVIQSKNRRILITAICAILSIFLANLLAHSLLIRENLFIAASLIALLYGHIGSQKITQNSSSKNKFFLLLNSKNHIFIYLIFFIIFIFSVIEIYKSFRSFPFTVDTQCFKTRTLYPDGWSTGIYQVDMPDGSKGIEINVSAFPPDIQKKPLTALLQITNNQNNSLASAKYLISDNSHTSFTLHLPIDQFPMSQGLKAIFKLNRCFIPINLGMNADERRLGVQISEVRFLN